MKTLNLVAGNALGKVLGLLREISLAYWFGATGAADAFRVSLTAALVPTHFFMGDVLEGAFVPLYVRLRAEDPAAASRLLRVVTVYLLVVSTLVGVALAAAGEAVVRAVGPGLAPETVALAGRMVRWMALGVPLYCLAHLTALQGLVLGRTGVLALRSPALNVGFVVAIPIAAVLGDPQWIGLGFTGALALYLTLSVWQLRGVGDHPLGRLDGSIGTEARLLVRTCWPLVWMMVLGQLLALVDRVAASFVGVGAVASLEFARTFVEMPQVLVGAAMATTSLARFGHTSEDELAPSTAAFVLPVLTASLACLVALGVAAPDLVMIVYQRGRFDAHAAASVTMAVRGMAVGAGFFTTAYVMMRVLSARLRSREAIVPMAAGVGTAALANVVLLPRLGLLGVTLATSLGQLVICALLARRLGVQRELLRRLPGWIVGAGLALALTRPVVALAVGSWVRAPLAGGIALAAFVAGAGVSRATRADLGAVVGIGKRIISRARGG